MQQFEIDYKNYLTAQTPTMAKLSVIRVLNGTPDLSITQEVNYYDIHKNMSLQEKEDSENSIFDVMFIEIPEVDHIVWENIFGSSANFTLANGSTETLPTKCRKSRPQI